MGFVRADIWRRFGALGQEPEVLGRIRALSEEPFPEGPESLVDAYLKAQQSQWARVVRERNITVG
jgi:hypothetical protein